MHVLSVTSELFPLIKTGGLADVAGALPLALAAEGIAVATLLPGYPQILAALPHAEPVLTLENLFGGPATVLRGTAAGHDLVAIDAPHLYARPGNPYLGPDGADWPDNAQRFAALGKIAALLATGAAPGLAPDILHLHDWQAALAAAYLRQTDAPCPAIVATIHNLAFRGQFPAHLLAAIELDPALFTPEGIEFYGDICFLKAALVYADRITTVSPSYADEIRTPHYGMGLDGLLRARGAALRGILNGIDTATWNPETDPAIAQPYTRAQLSRRAANKAALQNRCNLTADPAVLLCGVISRLTDQKGIDLLLETIPTLLALNMQLALVGSGERHLQSGFAAAAAAAPDRIACAFVYDETLAHQVQAGADTLLVPSRFEPCGLTQLCALRYGAVPLVSRGGGLADSVIDANAAALAQGVATGIQFTPVTRPGLELALGRLATLWQQPKIWRQLQRNGMAMDVSWHKPAHEYARLFREIRK